MSPSIGIVGLPEGASHANASLCEICSICCRPVWLREIGGAVYELTCDVETKVGSICAGGDLTGSRNSPGQFSEAKLLLATTKEIDMSEVVLFEHANFHGAHKHLYGSEPNLNAGDDNYFNDKISSFVITSGSWQFFRDANFAGPASNVFGVGRFNWVETVGIPNDSISSVRRVT